MDFKKTIVIYYSFEGNTHFIATEMAEKLGCDALRLIPDQEIKTHGVAKYIWGGRQAVMKKKPQLKEYELDLEKYETIIIGTPVWAWNYAPPLRTFFEETKIKGKEFILFCCHEGGMGKVFEKMREELQGNRVLFQVDFYSPLKNREESIKKLENFIKEIKKIG